MKIAEKSKETANDEVSSDPFFYSWLPVLDDICKCWSQLKACIVFMSSLQSQEGTRSPGFYSSEYDL